MAYLPGDWKHCMHLLTLVVVLSVNLMKEKKSIPEDFSHSLPARHKKTKIGSCWRFMNALALFIDKVSMKYFTTLSGLKTLGSLSNTYVLNWVMNMSSFAGSSGKGMLQIFTTYTISNILLFHQHIVPGGFSSLIMMMSDMAIPISTRNTRRKTLQEFQYLLDKKQNA